VYSEAVTSGIDQGAQVVAPEVVLATADLAAYVIAVRHNRSGAVRFVATGDGMMALYPVDGTDDTEPLVRYPLSALPLCLAADVDDQTVLLPRMAGARSCSKPRAAGSKTSPPRGKPA
jgi:hypothetical protein